MIVKEYFYHSIIFISILLLSSIFQFYFQVSSFTFGMFISILIIYLTNYSYMMNIKVEMFSFLTMITLFFLVFILLLYGFFTYDNFEIMKSIFSFLFLIYFTLGAFIYSNRILSLDNLILNKILYLSFIILTFDGIYSSINYLLGNLNNKEMILFSEPSFYALIILPLTLYHVLILSNVKKILILFIFFSIAISISNLTLFVGLLIILYISLPKSIFFVISSIVVFVAFYSMQDYILERINIFDLNNQNLSALVYMSGWSRAFYNLENTYGLGIGFQQLGYIGYVDYYREILILLGFDKINLHDGGTIGSKMISELGLLGVFLLLLYLLGFIKFINIVRRITNNKQLFAVACYLMFSVELFIRGVGYFTPTSFLFLSSLIILLNKNFRGIYANHL